MILLLKVMIYKMATAKPKEILCVGCGDDITKKASNRRSLVGDKSAKVLNVWRAFLETQEGEEIEMEDIINFIAIHDSKMCRSCYSAFERYDKLHDTIQANLIKASAGLMYIPSPELSQSPVRKRPRTLFGPPKGQSSGSPDVQVSD